MSQDHSVGLVIIDPQAAFVDGVWGRTFGTESIQPIVESFSRLAEFLKVNFSKWIPTSSAVVDPHKLHYLCGSPASSWNVGPILATKCYLEPPGDAAWVTTSNLHELIAAYPWVHKPGNDIMRNPLTASWLEAWTSRGLKTLLVVGCTTTSCVRVSAVAIKRAFPDLSVIVDASLCGARRENYAPNAHEQEALVDLYGAEFVRGKSAVDIALYAMRTAGVEVVERVQEPE